MVLLGFIDPPKGNKVGDDDDPTNWTISRIGGEPAFPNEETRKKLKASLICSKCQKEQAFVCQLYCPLDGHKYDRALYLFACRNPSCWNTSESWTVVRCQSYDDNVVESSPIDDEPVATVPTSSTDWCDDANAWNSDNDDDNQISKPTVTNKPISTKVESEVKMMDSMTIDEKVSSDEDDEIDVDTKKKSKAKNISVASSDAFNEWKKSHLSKPTLDLSNNIKLPFCYIVIDDEETVVNEAKLYEEKKLRNKVKKLEDIDEDGDENETNKRPKENYENTPDIEHGDVVFYKFQQKIRYAPDQIIRYDWSGQPLILTKLSGNQPSTCRYCQSPLIFEFQLMPALVNFLKIDNQIALEFGTVFVYTCSKNCWQESTDLYRLENVFLQTDPDQNLFD